MNEAQEGLGGRDARQAEKKTFQARRERKTERKKNPDSQMFEAKGTAKYEGGKKIDKRSER